MREYATNSLQQLFHESLHGAAHPFAPHLADAEDLLELLQRQLLGENELWAVHHEAISRQGGMKGTLWQPPPAGT